MVLGWPNRMLELQTFQTKSMKEQQQNHSPSHNSIQALKTCQIKTINNFSGNKEKYQGNHLVRVRVVPFQLNFTINLNFIFLALSKILPWSEKALGVKKGQKL